MYEREQNILIYSWTNNGRSSPNHQEKLALRYGQWSPHGYSRGIVADACHGGWYRGVAMSGFGSDGADHYIKQFATPIVGLHSTCHRAQRVITSNKWLYSWCRRVHWAITLESALTHSTGNYICSLELQCKWFLEKGPTKTVISKLLIGYALRILHANNNDSRVTVIFWTFALCVRQIIRSCLRRKQRWATTISSAADCIE